MEEITREFCILVQIDSTNKKWVCIKENFNKTSNKWIEVTWNLYFVIWYRCNILI